MFKKLYSYVLLLHVFLSWLNISLGAEWEETSSVRSAKKHLSVHMDHQPGKNGKSNAAGSKTNSTLVSASK
jgi:hypothetical protein